MAKQTINVGTTANDRRGDSLRAAFQKVNANFTELYTALGLAIDANLNLGAFEFNGSVMTTTDSTPVTIDQQVNITSDLVMSGAVVPATTDVYDLGSPTRQWRSLYLTGSTVYFNGVPLSVTNDGTIIVNGEVAATPSGDLTWDSIVNKPTTTASNGLTATTDINGNVNIGFSGILYVGSQTQYSFEEIVDESGPSPVYSSRLSLPLTTEFLGGDISLTAWGPGVNITVRNTDTLDEYSWSFSNDGNLTVPDKITFNDGTWQSTAFIGHAYELRNSPTGNLYVTLDDYGTINTPLLLPRSFTAVLDTEHFYPQPGIGLTDTPWEYGVEFQVNPDGTVQAMLDDPVRSVNPGYVNGHVFRFTEADHGIPGYTFDLTLITIINDNGNLVAEVGVTQPPAYPSTVKSLGAIKLTADTQSWVFGPDGKLTFPATVDGQLFLSGSEIAGVGNNSVALSSNTSVVINTYNPSLHTWAFSNDGSLAMPGNITQSYQDNTQCLPNVDTVVYTATSTDQNAVKLFVMAEGLTDGGGLSWDTQACDVIAVKGFNNNIVHVTTYGVTYSGASAIAEFDGQWNALTNRIEITCRPTSVTNNVRVSVHAIEMTTND